MIQLGQKAKDTLTGFGGVVTGRVEYLTGCAQYLLQPKVKGDGDFQEARWFDENRIEADGDEVVVVPSSDVNPGACDAAPIK